MMNISTSRSRRSGFTLIEVAIALAIFVFGALAIVQIFPPALGVIRNNESRVAATQLGETLLARTSGKPDSVPDAIYDGDTAGVWQDTPAAIVGSVSKNASLPAGMEAMSFNASALGRFKYIRGERHSIASNGSAVLNFPYVAGSVRVYEDDVVDGVQIDAYGYLDFTHSVLKSNSASFSDTSDPERPLAAYRSDSNVTYYVSYRWVNDAGRIQGVVDEPLAIPEDSGSWDSYTGRVLYAVSDTDPQIIPGAVSIKLRRFVPTTSIEGSPEIGLATPLGVGVAPKEYSFDYLVPDWHWLVDDGAPTSFIDSADYTGFNMPRSVSLPIKNIDGGFPLYTMMTSSNNNLVAPDLTPRFSIKKDTNGTPLYKSGELVYDIDKDGDGTPVPGARTRIVYRALDGWAQQLSVAAKSYIPYYQDSEFGGTRPIAKLPREPWREYYRTATGNQLYFRPSEAGKTVSVSYVDTAGNEVNGVVLTIDNIETSTVPPAGFFGTYDDNGTNRTNNKVAYTTITNLTGDPANVASILSVQGMSVQARTTWQNADRYNQVIVPAYRALLQ